MANSLQCIFENTAALTAAVSGPELEGDERDRVISYLNQLLASCGVGKGYYKRGVEPYNFTIENPFYRLKSVGYNRLTKHKDSEGLVSLILKVGASQIESVQQKQKVIDAINNVLRMKAPAAAPATTSFFMSSVASQQPTVDPTLQIFTEIKSIIPHGEALTEIIIVVNEYRQGVWPAMKLYNELKQTEKFNLLKQNLNCERVVPHVELKKEDFENYFKRPPIGFEEIWPQAIKENPDPTTLVPFPIQGFEQLLERQKLQQASIANQHTIMKELMERLTVLEHSLCVSHSKYTVCRQKQKQLSYRLLRVLATQTLIQRYGLLVDEKEEQLQSRLEMLNAMLNAPDRLKSRISAIYDVLRKDGDALKQKAQEQRHNENVLTKNFADVKRCLASRQSLLEDLVETVKNSEETLEIVGNNCCSSAK